MPTTCSGNGKTALKTSLSRYVASQTVGFASQFNPLGGTVTGAGFSGTGADTRVWTDPNGDRIVQLSELGPTGNPLFGTTALATTPAEDVQKGWFKRGYNWEYSGEHAARVVSAGRDRRRVSSAAGSATSRTRMRWVSARATTVPIASPRRPMRASGRSAGSRSAVCST